MGNGLKHVVYRPEGVCSRLIEIDLANGIIEHVRFTGGCSGNTQAVSLLVAGMDVSEAIRRLKGIDCRGKGTSCPDQLARALQGSLDE